MATQFEQFVNTELPKRPSLPVPAGGNLPAGRKLVTTGVGMGINDVEDVASSPVWAGNIEVIVPGQDPTYLDTLTELVTFIQALDSVPPDDVPDLVVNLQPGCELSHPAGVDWNHIGMTINGNDAHLTFAGQCAFQTTCYLRDIWITADTYLDLRNSYVQFSRLSCARIDIKGSTYLDHVNVEEANIILYSGMNLVCTNLNYSGAGTISGVGVLAINDGHLLVDSDSAPVIGLTAGFASLFDLMVVNSGSGGGITLQNTTGNPLPNSINGVVVIGGTIATGSAPTVIGSIKTDSAISGTAIARMDTGRLFSTTSIRADGAADDTQSATEKAVRDAIKLSINMYDQTLIPDLAASGERAAFWQDDSDNLFLVAKKADGTTHVGIQLT